MIDNLFGVSKESLPKNIAKIKLEEIKTKIKEKKKCNKKT